MGKYFRTVEMGRFARFACWACGGELVERLVGACALELACEACGLGCRVETQEPIAARPQLSGATRYRLGERVEHGPGFRCLNCARELLAEGKPTAGSVHRCQRCKTVHRVRSISAPGSPSAASTCPAAMPASTAP